MPALKADIIAQLKKDILAVQGFKPFVHTQQHINLGTINHSFPVSTFPLGTNHEFICSSNESLAASSGFIAGILSTLLQKGGAAIWISSHIIFPPALVSFGIDPSQVIFIRLKNQKEILWATEEALKCEALTAVVAGISSIDLTSSRRLQLASEQSRTTGFILRHQPTQYNTTACTCRWQINHLPAGNEENLPGIGFPRWNVELIKVRNGKPGQCQLEWTNGQFNEVMIKRSSITEEHKQAV